MCIRLPDPSPGIRATSRFGRDVFGLSLREDVDRRVERAEGFDESALHSRESVQSPCRSRFRGAKEMDGLVTEDAEMSLAVGWLRRELDQVLERLPLPHGIGAAPPRKFELRDT